MKCIKCIKYDKIILTLLYCDFSLSLSLPLSIKCCWLQFQADSLPATGCGASEGSDWSDHHAEDSGVLLHRAPVPLRQGSLS